MNPINFECECDKSCDVADYLYYKNFKCRKRLTDKLVEECSEDINGNKIIYNYEETCNSCIIYIVLSVIFLMISLRISSVFIYFYS